MLLCRLGSSRRLQLLGSLTHTLLKPVQEDCCRVCRESEGASAVRCISIPKDSLMLLSVSPSPGPLTAQAVTCVRGDVVDVMTAGPHADGNIKRCSDVGLRRKAVRRGAGSLVAGLGGRVGEGSNAPWIKILGHSKT